MTSTVVEVLSAVAETGHYDYQDPTNALVNELSKYGVAYSYASQEFYKAGRPPEPQSFRLRLIETYTTEVVITADTYEEAIAKAELLRPKTELYDHKWEEVSED